MACGAEKRFSEEIAQQLIQDERFVKLNAKDKVNQPISVLILQPFTDISFQNGNTALHYAVTYKAVSVVQCLLNSDTIDINLTDKVFINRLLCFSTNKSLFSIYFRRDKLHYIFPVDPIHRLKLLNCF